MAAGANFAWANRQVITHWARAAFEDIFGVKARQLGLFLVCENCHNVARMEEHLVDGAIRKLCVHRKGATRAFPPAHPGLPEIFRETGQPVLIPGDMGRTSYVVVGEPAAMDLTWGSTCHGAGRRLSRTAATKLARGRFIDRELYRDRGIIVRAHEIGTLAEEMPEAYKNVSEVVDTVEGAGLSRKVAILRPMGVIKG